MRAVDVRIMSGPLSSESPPDACPAGAVLMFEGIIRPSEGEQPIAAIEYEVYRPMAERMLSELAEETLERHGLRSVLVRHSEGRVPVGACSFRLWIVSDHRAEGFRAAESFLDRMKTDVPIWKRVITASSEIE